MGSPVFNEKSITMDDIAAELGISKSTVSRALAGSSRISAETRQRVQKFAEEHGFQPNLVAKALAGAKTLNIAAVLPLESTSLQMMFFHQCLCGITSRSMQADYSVLVCMVGKRDSQPLERILREKKVDAVILTQLKKNDQNVEILKKSGIPFVVIGSGAGEDVPQVDSRMKENCSAFTKKCLERLTGQRRVMFVCGSLDVEANNNRLSGYLDGIEAFGKEVKSAVCTDIDDLNSEIDFSQWDMILCSDDIVCSRVLDLMNEKNILPGEDIKIASFHDSVLLENRNPGISALRVDAFSLGAEASSVVMNIIAGNKFENMNYVDCSFEMRNSV